MKRWQSKHTDIRSKYLLYFTTWFEYRYNFYISVPYGYSTFTRAVLNGPVYWNIDDTHKSLSPVLDTHFSRVWPLWDDTKHDYAPGCRLSIWNSLVAPALRMWLTGFGISVPVHDWLLMGDVVQSVQLQRWGEMRRPSWVIQNEWSRLAPWVFGSADSWLVIDSCPKTVISPQNSLV